MHRLPGRDLPVAFRFSHAWRHYVRTAAPAADPDEYAANLVTRGYMPGQISQLHGRLAETEAELADEEAKLERAARVQRDFAAGKIGMGQLLAAQDADEGDAAKAEKLQRRADSLRRQIGELAGAMAPREVRERNAVEEAASRAQAVLAEVARMRAEDDAAAARSRAKVREERSAFYAARGGLPFASSGDAAEDGEASPQVSARADLPAPPPGVTWAQLSQWIAAGWRP